MEPVLRCEFFDHCRMSPFDPDIGVCLKKDNDDHPWPDRKPEVAAWFRCRHWTERRWMANVMNFDRGVRARRWWHKFIRG